MQIWQLIIQIGKKFGMRVNEFEIITNSGPLGDKIYNQKIYQYDIPYLNIQRKD